MVIKKVINNNIVTSLDEGVEVVVSGRGLGFGHREGDKIDEAKIEKIYRIENEENLRRFKDLLAKLPLQNLQIANEVIALAKRELKTELNENIYLTLTDHINFALERFEKGMMFENAILFEVKAFYPDEFRIGEKAVDLIQNTTGHYLGQDEAASIALHIVSAELNEKTSMAFTVTRSVKNILEILNEEVDREIPGNARRIDDMIPIFKHLVYRIILHEQYDGDDVGLYEFATGNYRQETKICERIAGYLEEQFGEPVRMDEKSYIIILLRKLIK
jgi:beta-glucoside operon transcriptional antiterminator